MQLEVHSHPQVQTIQARIISRRISRCLALLG
jgi:hypothetical protein